MVYNTETRFITIDYDTDNKTELDHLFFILRLEYVCRKTRCYITTTYKGYHVYIEYDNYDFWKSIALRTYLLDDRMRIEFDIFRLYNGLVDWTETLFIAKRDHDYEYTEEPIDLDRLKKQLLY